MGGRRQSGGVEIRETSIRIIFSHQGKQQKETLYLDNDPLPPTPANIKYAIRIAAEVKDKIRLGQFDYLVYFPHSPRAQVNQIGTLGEFMDKWYAQLELKPSTRRGYRISKDGFWKPQLGHMRLSSVKHSDITTALKNGGWKSGKTRNNKLSMLRSMFDLAVSDGLIPSNPCVNIGNASWQKKKPDPFTIEEAQKIVASMLERYPQPVANYFEFMFFTGLRTSEGIGLEWNDVDFNTKTILVRQGFVLGKMEDTKTSKERTVSLNSMAFAALKRQKAWTFLQEGGRVFHDPATNEPWPDEQNARRRHWIPTLRLLGIRYRRPYSMRSTYATIGLMAGANPAYIAGQLGHGVDVFFKDYAAWINGKHNATELDKIEAQIQGNIPKLSLANIKQA